MKNTTSGPEDSIFRKKGFFIALYSCLGAVAILALVITIANFGQPSFQAEDYEQDAALVGADQVEPYMAQVDEEAWFRPRTTPPPSTQPPQMPTAPPRATPLPPPMPRPTPEPPDSEVVNPHTPTPEPAAEVEEPEPPPPLTFSPFTEGSELLWPVDGEVLMRFSMDALIFDPTLVQFRTNDDLRIAADEGDYVQAAAEGKVLSIGRNVVRGSYVKIDHGNGWMATYGQLADNKLVSVGDIVSAGQNIGTVGHPSIFGSMLGNHVNLRVTREDVPVNPYELLTARGD